MKRGHEALLEIASRIPGVVWPPLPNPGAALLLSLLHQLAETQWLAPEALAAGQRRQLAALADHAAAQSPFCRERFAAAALSPSALAEPDGLARLPVLTRRDLQAAGDSFFCAQAPQSHLPIAETRTSGSSGEPVVVRRTAVSQLFWLANTLREHLWQERDFRQTLAIVRADPAASRPQRREDWGEPVSLVFDSGPSHSLSITNDLGAQAEWLRRVNPGYLLTYPTNLAALAEELTQRGIRLPALRQVRSIGETLSEETRSQVRQGLGVEVADVYSSQEVGVIALQCPASGHYHVMAESLIVEVLDETDRPCAPGEVGRIVVTDPHNYATPLLRYEIGDYAEVAGVCACGRGLPSLKRILGRRRNLLVLPDGRRHWPLVGFQRFRDLAPIRQYQLIQRSLEQVEVRLVTDHPLSPEQETRLAEVIRAALGYPFQLDFFYFEGRLPTGPGGKFEEFVSELA